MVLKMLCGLVLAVIVAMPLVANTSAEFPENVSWAINSDGSAIFFGDDAGNRPRLWTVTCRVKLRGCVARNDQSILWSDRMGQIWLRSEIDSGLRASVKIQNQVVDIPKLFSRPLPSNAIRFLSMPDASLLVEAADNTYETTSLRGLSHVAAYLSWLESAAGRLILDASVWQPTIDANSIPNEMQRYQFLDESRTAEPLMLVPVNKPQIEFAARAQGGTTIATPD